MNDELRQRRENRTVSVVRGLVNPVSPEVTSRISRRERHEQLRIIDDRSKRISHHYRPIIGVKLLPLPVEIQSTFIYRVSA